MVDYAKRMVRLKRVLREKELPAFLVTSFVNVAYLTGFTGGDSFLLVHGDSVRLISDPRYEEQISEECPGLDVFIRKPSVTVNEAAMEVVRKSKITRFAIEADSLTVAQFEQLKSVCHKHSWSPSRVSSSHCGKSKMIGKWGESEGPSRWPSERLSRSEID